MRPLFPAWTNTAIRLGLGAFAALGGLVVVGPMLYVRLPYNTDQFVPVDQPVEFDHRHHVRDNEMACIYCHTEAERSASAGLPSTETCMGCHAQVWSDSPLLEPVRASYFSGTPIPWNRVHDLPDFVFFDHSVHVRDGIECRACHGPVDQMARVYQVAPLTMVWCLDCHREAEGKQRAQKRLSTSEQQTTWTATMTNMTPAIPRARREITHLTTCTACHR